MPLPELPTWPAEIDWQPRRRSFADQMHGEVRAVRMEGGNTRREARPADEVVVQQVMWRFTPAEYAVIRAFLIDARATGWQGWWVDASGTPRWGAITVDGAPPKGTPSGRMIDVTAQIEIVPDDEEPEEP